ncbi:MAG: FHA domain-containing protein [Blastocatellia bacterium]|nr:FHA domain-containing protein [Blastocatellia bacterium]
MIDFSNRYLSQLVDFLTDSVSSNPLLTFDDLDPKEIVFQMDQEIRLKTVKWHDDLVCIPNVVRILLPEDKAEKTEEIEVIFNAHPFVETLNLYLSENRFSLLMPLRVEVEVLSKGSSRLMYSAGRCALNLDWPLAEETELLDVFIDDVKKQVLKVQQHRSAITRHARLSALNADVYHNNYVITKEITYLGRLRAVRDKETGKFLRRNDFVFSQLDTPEAIGNSVSRQHAKIEFSNNYFYLSDQGSANSTTIERDNGEEVEVIKVTENVQLQNNDTIVLGSARVKFNLIDQINMLELALQQIQSRTSIKTERAVPMPTMKLSSYSPTTPEN